MKKSLIKSLVISLTVSLVLGVMGSFVLAKKKELTPKEFSFLPLEERLKYKTIKIRAVGDTDLEKKQFTVNLNELVHSGSVGGSRRWYSKALFELAHPKVKVEGISFNLWPRDAKTIMAAVAGGTAPSMYPIWLGGGPQVWINKGMAADITDLIKEWDQTDYLKKNGWAVWKYAWKDGRCYGLPERTGVDNRMIIFRKDWCKEAGIFNERGEPGPSDEWTWEDFREIAIKLTNAKKKRWGFCYAPFIPSKTNQIGFAIAFDFGAFNPWNFIAPDKSGKYTWRFTPTPPIIEMLKFLKKMRWEDKSMLTGTQYDMHVCFRSEFKASRAGMVWGDTRVYLGDFVRNPWVFSETVPFYEFAGSAPQPKGKYNLRCSFLHAVISGFDPTLNKEELKAAFDWYDWNTVGVGKRLELMETIDHYFLTGSGGASLIYFHTTPYYKVRNLPAVTIPSMTELSSPDWERTYKQTISIPRPPDMFEYGFRITYRGVAEELPALSSLFQAVVTNPEADIQAELRKTADILNKTVYNYKIEGDKEKFKAYYTALEKFYEKNFPEFYQSSQFKEQLEKYHKVW